MQVITQSEALEALKRHSIGDRDQFSIVGNPDRLGRIWIYFVRIWHDDCVDFEDVAFIREKGKVKVYSAEN